MEAALAVRLFERFQTGYVLTDAGDELLALDTDVWLLTHPDLRRVSRIRALTAFLTQALATHPALS